MGVPELSTSDVSPNKFFLCFRCVLLMAKPLKLLKIFQVWGSKVTFWPRPTSTWVNLVAPAYTPAFTVPCKDCEELEYNTLCTDYSVLNVKSYLGYVRKEYQHCISWCETEPAMMMHRLYTFTWTGNAAFTIHSIRVALLHTPQ